MRGLILILILCAWSCKEKRYHDKQELTDIVYTAGLEDAFEFHKKLNREFKDPETSPLPDRYRKNFNGLDFF
ncbi:MAG TPA: hypothetical protein VKZ93_05090, partial [Arenibacter sp.]|nr:hypothetical protein [Arenibacter sp.]